MNKTFYSEIIKRLFDFMVSIIVLAIISPFFLLIVFLQILFNGFPIFYIQPRLGKSEKIFYLIKFRTMNDKKGTDGKLLSNFKRTTWFGSLLRKTSIDELPNLINVLKGDMSIIGPRPLLVEYLPLYSTEQKKRHLVRPGMSGLAQVKGRNTIDWNKKFTYDLLYINKISFVFDLKIIFLTFYEVFFNTKSVNKSKNETNEKFNGKN